MISVNLIHLLGVFPALSLLINIIAGEKSRFLSAKLASYFMGIGFIAGFFILFFSQLIDKNANLPNYTNAGIVVCTLIYFISFIVHRYSIRFMDGDALYKQYFFNLSAITLSTILFTLTDNLIIFWFSWTFSSFLLVLLMIHKKRWIAAMNSGVLALKNLLASSMILLFAIVFLVHKTHITSIQSLIHESSQIPSLTLLFFSLSIVASALIQSALWPFHRWLLSSLNSPTPVSALMHAGLISGGGILILKFAPLLSDSVLNLLFILGVISALLGTFWKLIQHDIKRMLACSTLSQMGFMMMQCGLGLYSSALAHLCWHGLFKAHLFLGSGSAIEQQKSKAITGFPVRSLLISILGGAISMMIFALSSNKVFALLSPSSVLLMFAFFTGAQLNLSLINDKPNLNRVLLSFSAGIIAGLSYGLSIHLIESLVPDLGSFAIPKLTLVHLIPIFIFVSLWMSINLGLLSRISNTKFWSHCYMTMLNSSQPHPNTVTASRNLYFY
ncbi:proton-conducting transporter transmembrane domain-containing protein [Legionella hackeliae]|uniref:Putative NADH-ubiquinone oxidoreductase chain 5 n=1 Tax=Legionella hackeliae TaxID=449 RepID=A0A0A8UVG1_LEGHA|nr:proton-conducting transporter membrane subunit [Legionella hackeliae]KTD13191.1 NADH-ubiquinone oxidoreductase chain 5 [Legionella hackeliae]CEK11496.1 putative NADH-ubiquinone oxidoreductase chain 5 [Legionella hackeliae]STX48264.1 NADH-ubiquinone oxidoreductase chain 5 [Legionella hackeliae]